MQRIKESRSMVTGIQNIQQKSYVSEEISRSVTSS
jgi:hypothetical protein